MNRRCIYFFFAIFFIAMAWGGSVHAQLLEDRNKLKTSTRDRKPFTPFKQNVTKPKKTNQKPDVQRARSARVSQENAGQQGNYNVRPRYSRPKFDKISRWHMVAPRFTKDIAGKYERRNIQPRYTQGNAGKYDRVNVQPRYTQGNAGRYDRINVQPRYTQEKAGSSGRYVMNPRFTRDHAGASDGRKIAPRFTQENAGYYKRRTIIPRYTQDIAGQGYDKYIANPRFTVRDKRSPRYKVQPRFSAPPDYVDFPVSGRKRSFVPSFQFAFQKAKYKQGRAPNFYGPKVKRVYTPSHSVARHNQTLASYQRYKSRFNKKSPYSSQTEFFGPKVHSVFEPSNSMAKYNKTIDSYQKYISRSGKKSPHAEQTEYLAKMKKMRKHKDAHPSANYLSAKYTGNPVVRSTKRKVSVTWVRIFGNQTRPDGVKKSGKKAKFDKDEKDIWHNEEREYTRK